MKSGSVDPAMCGNVDAAMDLAKTVTECAGEEDPLYGVVRSANVMRRGLEANVSVLAEEGELLKNAPAVKGDYFKVANILE